MTKLEMIDVRIKEVESALVYLLHERLALVKAEKIECEHDFESVSIKGLECISAICRNCGVAK